MSADYRVRRFGGVHRIIPWLLPFFTALSISYGEIRHRHIPEASCRDAARNPEIRTDLVACRNALPFLPALERHSAPPEPLPRREIGRADHPVFEVADIPESEGEELYLHGHREGIPVAIDGPEKRVGRSRRLVETDVRKAVRCCLRASGVAARPPPTRLGAVFGG